MSNEWHKKGSLPILWIVLTATVAAAIPVVIYLILTRGEDERPRTQPGQSVQEDLQRLGEEEALYRDAVSVAIGERTLVEAVELRKKPGIEDAVVRTLTVHLPLLLDVRKASLDDGWTKLFESLPPGSSGMVSKAVKLYLADPSERFPGGLTVQGAGSLRQEERSVRLEASWIRDEQVCALEVVYTRGSGLLFVQFDCPGTEWPTAFLEAGYTLGLDGLTITSGSYVKVRHPRLVRDEDGKTLFAASELELNARRALSRRVLEHGLADDMLAREKEWTLRCSDVETSLASLPLVPPFARFTDLPGVTVTAKAIDADSLGTVRLDEPGLAWPGVGSLRSSQATLAATPEGGQHIALADAVLVEDRFKLSWQTAAADVEVDRYKTLWLRCRSFAVKPPLNPLRLAALMQQVQALRAQLATPGELTLDLPPLVVPAGVPDLRLRLEGGSFSLPGMADREITDMRVYADVTGAMLAKAEAGLCLGPECKELKVAAGVETDAVGRVARVSLQLQGEKAAALAMRNAPEAISALSDLVVDCQGHAGPDAGVLNASCTLVADGLRIFHKRLAMRPITFPRLRIEGEARVDTVNKSVQFTFPKIQAGRVYFRLAFDVERYNGLPAVKVKVDFPEQSCHALLRSVPEGFAPRLENARLTGSIWFNVTFEVDLKDIRKSIKLEADGDLDRCDAITLGRDFDVSELNRPDYVHRVVVAGEDLGIDVGPGTDRYVPLNQVPKVVQAAAYGTEDLAFFRHNGFRLGLIRRALILYLERGYYAYGGSTISQQLVKNLYLTRTKTLSRKFQEAVIVWKMEKEVSKERIFELYLNCIEYGPRIWGISRAAQVYFGKHPTQLKAMEAAFIMGLKPDPQYGYLQFARGKLNKHWRKNLDRVLKRLLDMGALSRAEYDRAMRIPLHFHKGQREEAAAQDEDRPVRTGQEELEEL